MKLYYNNTKIYYVVKDIDLFYFTHTTQIPLDEFTIDEIDPANKYICLDLLKTVGKVNNVGVSKYSIENNTLFEEENWIEQIPL